MKWYRFASENIRSYMRKAIKKHVYLSMRGYEVACQEGCPRT